jgi:hypothetical protein
MSREFCRLFAGLWYVLSFMLIQRIFENVVRSGRVRLDPDNFKKCFRNVSTVNVESTNVYTTIAPLRGLRIDSDYVTSHTRTGTVLYSRDQLLSLRKTYPVSDELFYKIKGLGIDKHRRSRRGGRHVRKTIPIVRTQYHRSRQCNKYGGINRNNLVNIKFDCKKLLDIHCWNAQSIGNKTTTIHDYLLDKDIYVLVITETWRREEDPVIIGECTPSGYSF